MRLWLRLAWDGTALHGVTPVADRRTVASVLAEALESVGASPGAIDTASRTDAGVHADDAVLWVDGLPDRSLRAWWAALRRHLPPDVRPVAVGAGSTLRVVSKTYRYTLDPTPGGLPRQARYAWAVRAPWEGLVDAAVGVAGPVDWSPFRRRGETREDLRRTVLACAWRRDGARYVVDITGDGFPRRGVRALVGGMVRVAQGHAPAEALWGALRGVDHPIARQQAPAHGLCLGHTEVAGDVVWWSGERDPGDAGP